MPMLLDWTIELMPMLWAFLALALISATAIALPSFAGRPAPARKSMVAQKTVAAHAHAGAC